MRGVIRTDQACLRKPLTQHRCAIATLVLHAPAWPGYLVKKYSNNVVTLLRGRARRFSLASDTLLLLPVDGCAYCWVCVPPSHANSGRHGTPQACLLLSATYSCLPAAACRRMHPNPALSVLYVLTECIHTEGYLTAYKVDPSTGGMRELGRVTLTGRSSCYISFDKYAHHAIITNYWDGLINVVELSPAGVPLRVVQEHQQTRRPTWRQVESREVCAHAGGCWHGAVQCRTRPQSRTSSCDRACLMSAGRHACW